MRTSKQVPDDGWIAFISYKRCDPDQKVARWLIAALETYRVPKALQKEGYPPRLGKVFRDEDDLEASPDLSESIKRALRASKFLIVVCSPETAASEWVRQEIEYFVSLGRADKIRVVLARGEPRDAFPPALTERISSEELADGTVREVKLRREPLGADFRNFSRWRCSANRRALLRLAAPLLGVKYDQLVRREEQRRRQRIKRTVTVALSVLVILLIWWWDFNRIKVDYFASSTENRGIPVGFGPLDEPTRRARAVSLRFEKSRGLIRRLSQVSSYGVPVGVEGSPTREFIYRREWPSPALEQIVERNAEGRVVRKMQYSADGLLIELLEANRDGAQAQSVNSAFLREQSDDLDVRTRITRWRVTYDDRGNTVTRLYEDGFGDRRADAQGAFGYRAEYDRQNFRVAAIPLNEAGQDTVLRAGPAREEWDYDTRGEPIAERILDRAGKPFGPLPAGWAARRILRDAVGNPTRTSFLGADGKPHVRPDGTARFDEEYDAHGNRTRLTYHDSADAIAMHSDGYASLHEAHDEFGRAVRRHYRDSGGKNATLVKGYSAESFAYDEHHRLKETRYWDSEGKLAPSGEGYAIVRYTYDAAGFKTETAYFDAADVPALSRDGVAGTTYRYDRERLAGVTWWDTQRKQTLNSLGVARASLEYDNQGNQTSIRYFGAADEPVLQSHGVHRRLSVYDDRGNRILRSFRGLNDEPVLTSEGITGVRTHRDDRGNPDETINLGIDENVVEDTDGIAITRRKFNAKGLSEEISYFDRDKKPTRQPQGVHRQVIVFDERGLIAERYFYDPQNQPMLTVGGFWSEKVTRNMRGQVVKSVVVDTQNKILTGNNPIPITRNEFDTAGKLIAESYYDADEKPLAGPDGIARRTSVFDRNGNRIETATFDAAGRLKANKEGIARTRSAYDALRHLTEERYYGENDLPAKRMNSENTNGEWGASWRYDARGKMRSRTSLDGEGLPVDNADHFSRWEAQYNLAGYQTEIRYFAADGKPAAHIQEHYGYKSVYDPRGHEIGWTYLGPDGQPQNQPAGFAEVRDKVDAAGRLMERTYFDLAGQPADGPGGYHRRTRTFRPDGQEMEVRYFDLQGNPKDGKAGYHRTAWTFEANGKPIVQKYFAADGHEVPAPKP